MTTDLRPVPVGPPPVAGGRGVVADDTLPLPPGVQLRAAWAAARARNALRHRGLLITGAVLALVLALGALVLVPREAMRAARNAAPRPGEKIDTVALAAAVTAEQRAFAQADSAVGAGRAAAARARQVLLAARARAAAALPPATPATRDSLAGALGALERLIARAQTSPLPSSYRALAESPELRGDARVRVLVDSLDEVEREREAFGVVGGVDPIYVSLTNTTTRLGRAIEAVAERRRTALRDALTASETTPAVGGTGPVPAPPAAGAPPTAAAPAGGAGVPPQQQDATAPGSGTNPPAATGVTATPAGARTLSAADSATLAAIPVADTLGDAVRRDAARTRLAQAEAALRAARARNEAVDRRVAAARARANFDTPPVAMLGAALAVALVAGFLTALGGEVRRPRVADAREAERVTRTRVLAVVRPEAVIAERARRRADVDVPPLVDTSVESYRLLYLSMAATGAAVPVVTVVGAEAAIAAAVAANVAAIAAEDGRSTLVVDADMGRAAASVAMGVGMRPGLADVLRAGLPVAESIVPVPVGRAHTVDVLPAGLAPTPPLVRDAARELPPGAQRHDDDPVVLGSAFEPLRDDLARLARRYDFTVVSIAPTEVDRGAQSVLVAPDVIVCARAGHTPLTGLAREITRLRALGARVRGLVLWEGEPPVIPTRAELRDGARGTSRAA
jgi:Mrp family chromosome partitioning ATPase